MKKFLKNIIVTVLTWEARLVLARYKPKIVAITGSVGKTSTKDAIYTVLAERFYTRKSDKSFNSEIGLPLTILGLPNGWNNPIVWIQNIFRGFFMIFYIPQATSRKKKTRRYPEWLVLEVGADRPGDIESVSRWLNPDAAVITWFGTVPVHVEFFASREDVIREKSFLAKGVKDNGVLVLNNDDEDIRALRDIKRASTAATFSITHESNFQASNLEITYATREGEKNPSPSGISFKVNNSGNSVPIFLSGTVGRQHVYPVLAALAFGESMGLNMVEMSGSIRNHQTPPGRMRLIPGVKHSTVIDDTYNASPVAVSEALRALKDVKTKGKKIAVLGDMLELGKYSGKEHEKIGKEAQESCDKLVTVGVRARGIAAGALYHSMDESNILQFDTALEAAKTVEDIIAEGDIVLVKGSQGVRMEKIVEEIMANPEEKERVLVRQETEWKQR